MVGRMGLSCRWVVPSTRSTPVRVAVAAVEGPGTVEDTHRGVGEVVEQTGGHVETAEGAPRALTTFCERHVATKKKSV
jgi:hypothetical protein